MTPEERSLLERTCTLATENNEILRKMRRSSRISIALTIAYWVFIVGLSVGAYYLIQPYVEMVTGLYGGDASSIENATNSLRDLLN